MIIEELIKRLRDSLALFINKNIIDYKLFTFIRFFIFYYNYLKSKSYILKAFNTKIFL